MTAIDQAEIDKILASAEADTPEGRLEKLEKEVELLKGSIKKLLMDIRETMNNLENPFQNLQSVASVETKPQKIQFIPMSPEKFEKEEGEEKKEEEEWEEKKEIGPKKQDLLVKEVEEVPKVEEIEVPKQMAKPKIFGVKQEKAKIVKGREKWDIDLVFELMSWLRSILERHNFAAVRIMLDIFEKAGYISSETKNFIIELSELVGVNKNFEELIFEFYKLQKLLEPNDTSMDSKLLRLLLERRS